jgi:hypothetical protein
VPGGHDYRGPGEALARYRAVVEAARGEAVIKGAKNPYTSRNGHMFSFLTPDGSMALRLSEQLGEQFQAEYESGPVMQYGSVMRGYVSVPAELLAKPTELARWFDEAWDWIGSLPPEPTKKQ